MVDEGKDTAMILLQQQMQAIVGELRGMTKEVTSVKEIGRQTQGFAQQLQNLQDILKNPKQRGILGEYYLETVLKNVLPPGMYQMQYPFKNGEIVDAAVFVSDKIVPIDSKFSLDNYNRLVHASEAERPAFEKAFVNDLKLRIKRRRNIFAQKRTQWTSPLCSSRLKASTMTSSPTKWAVGKTRI